MAVSPKHFQFPSAFTLPPSSSSFSSTIPSSPLSVTASPIRVSTKIGTVRVSFSRRSIVRYNDHAGEDEEGVDDEEEDWSFEEAVTLFNKRDYYKSHDALESLWIRAEEPTRTLIHGILQCAVGFHHLFNNVKSLSLSFSLVRSRQNMGFTFFNEFIQNSPVHI